MNYCHITDTTWNPRPLPTRYGEIAENYDRLPTERHFADGWRVAVPAVAPDGTRIVKSGVEFGADYAQQTILATVNIADEQAAQESAEVERKNTPLVFDQPIETPSLVLPAHDAGTPGWGYVADPDGALVPFVYHASPIPDAAEIKARKDAAVLAYRAAKDAAKAELASLKAKLATAEAEVAALKTKAATAESDLATLTADVAKLKAGKP